MTSTTTHTAACFCGAVEIEVTGEPIEMGYCHCGSCRLHSGAPLVAYVLWKSEHVRITTGRAHIGSYNKTGMSDRYFCRRCGGPVLTRHPSFGLTDVPAAAVRGITFAPSVHLNYAEAVLPIEDALPKLKDFPAAVGGSGEVVQYGGGIAFSGDHARAVQRRRDRRRAIAV